MSQIIHEVSTAVNLLKQGKLVAIPTETVYGLAARADCDEAIHAVFDTKKRPLNHPLILHIAKDWPISLFAEAIPDYVTTLIAAFWPGPLTLVLPARLDKVSLTITGGQTSVALRSPNHPLTQALLSLLDIPLVAPSANPYEKISPTTALHVQQSFPEADFAILEGGRCDLGIESTIVDATNPKGFAILRQGSVTEAALEAVLPGKHLKTESHVRSPGKCERHYQPNKPLIYFEHSDALHAYVLANPGINCVLSFNQWPEFLPNPYFLFENDPNIAAYELYYQLRLADASQANLIMIDLPPDTIKWAAVRERIIKAGSAAPIARP